MVLKSEFICSLDIGGEKSCFLSASLADLQFIESMIQRPGDTDVRSLRATESFLALVGLTQGTRVPHDQRTRSTLR